MKRISLLFGFVCLLLNTNAQQCPSGWVKYTSGGYLYDIQGDSNDNGLSETDFKNNLLNIARTNLAKQIQVRVQDFAEVNKSSKDGRTSIIYSANTIFSTDVNFKLVETKTSYDSATKSGYAIAYINRSAVRDYYNNELVLIYNKIENATVLAQNFIGAGFKPQAKSELESSLQLFKLIDEPIFWMNIFGESQLKLSEWMQRFNAKEQLFKQLLAELKHATTIYVSCSADVFGKQHPTLQNELKGILAAKGCNFTEDSTKADWSVTIRCSARESSSVRMGNLNTYFSYVDACVVIDKVITAQRIYEDAISVKGGHTSGYHDAANAAYKDIKAKIIPILQNYIK